MEIAAFLQLVRTSSQQRCFFHFSPAANLESIKQHGLLATAELGRLGIIPPIKGGNQWSQDADRSFGMDEFVHLSFTNSHPMLHRLRKENPDLKVHHFQINPSILELKGVLIALGVANSAEVPRMSVADALPNLDLKVLYQRTDWKDSLIQQRLQAAKKCEILVPRHVPPEYIMGYV